jgi:hypothetical protein
LSVVFTVPGWSFAADKSFHATLTGVQVAPAVITAATGEFHADLNAGEDTLTYELTFANLEGGFPFVGAIFIGQPNVHGGLSVALCGANPPGPNCPHEVSATITGTITAADVLGPVGQGIGPLDLAGLIAAMRAGLTYVTIENISYPGGEIRGQLK